MGHGDLLTGGLVTLAILVAGAHAGKKLPRALPAQAGRQTFNFQPHTTLRPNTRSGIRHCASFAEIYHKQISILMKYTVHWSCLPTPRQFCLVKV